MNLPISNRLRVCCGFVAPGERVADIGCDHGYLSIYLLKNNIARSVIASDINEQPLQSAMINAEKYGVRDKISFYLSDGVRNIPRDFDTLVCAGMGADTMISILEAAPWLCKSSYRLILQCQSKTPMLRKYLSDNGWRITEETVLRDGRFLYTVMEVVFQPDYPRLTIGEQYFPPALLENPAVELPEYYARITGGLRLAVQGKGAENVPEQARALAELEQLIEQPELSFIKEALK